MVRDFTFYVISVFACGNVMLLMLVIFGKFGSFLGVEAFKGGGGGGGGTRRSLCCIFMQLFTVASKQGALYLVMGNNAIGSTFAAGYRIIFRGWVSKYRCFVI